MLQFDFERICPPLDEIAPSRLALWGMTPMPSTRGTPMRRRQQDEWGRLAGVDAAALSLKQNSQKPARSAGKVTAVKVWSAGIGAYFARCKAIR